MLSPNLLTSKNPYVASEAEVHDDQLPTFHAESKSAKIPKVPMHQGGGGGEGGGCMTANFQLLVLSPNLLKSKSPFARWEGDLHDGQLPTLDAESKSANIPKIPLRQLAGVGRSVMANFQLLMLSPNLLKSKSSFMASDGKGGLHDSQLPTFGAESKSAKIQKVPLHRWEGGA